MREIEAEQRKGERKTMGKKRGGEERDRQTQWKSEGTWKGHKENWYWEKEACEQGGV